MATGYQVLIYVLATMTEPQLALECKWVKFCSEDDTALRRSFLTAKLFNKCKLALC